MKHLPPAKYLMLLFLCPIKLACSHPETNLNLIYSCSFSVKSSS